MINKKLLPEFIELETSTFCNRRCPWCPNSIYKRGSKQKHINKKLFLKIIKDLKNIDYKGSLALHNYNEPLLDRYLYDWIKIIRKELPKVKIIIFTNGDFLTKTICNKLLNSGVSTLYISVHDTIKSKDYENSLHKFLNKLKIKKIYKDISDDLGKKYKINYNKLEIIYYIPFTHMLTSRGGIMKSLMTEISNSSFCYLPFISSAIDYQGNVKVCCEVYPSNKEHRDYGIIGNLKLSTFDELWFSKKYNSFRKKFLNNNIDNPLCKKCPKNDFGLNKNKLSIWKKYL